MSRDGLNNSMCVCVNVKNNEQMISAEMAVLTPCTHTFAEAKCKYPFCIEAMVTSD